MDELVPWLHEQLNEDERKVVAMEREEVRARAAPIFQSHPPNWLAGVSIFVSSARWRAEIDAKRKLIEMYQAACRRQDDNSAKFVLLTRQRHLDQAEFTRVKTHGWELSGQVVALAAAVAQLATPYADRPGFQEWGLS